ncbi:MAG: prolyl aminopeptidase [Candidatus Scalindua sp.]|nr:prolyl aminopeptidase [Candidatus Scalindua sp.]
MTRTRLFPPRNPYHSGFLKVSNLHTLYFEEVGNPEGKPVIFLHGGPGVGIHPGYRRFFDYKFYRVILFDQRGSGKSTPFAELRENTTWHLVEDLEKLREHLKIRKWIVTGGSWGSTLALAYAQSFPESVKGIIIRGVFTARASDMEWLFSEKGAGQIWPDEFEKFMSILSKREKKEIIKSYYKRLTSRKSKIAWEAARAFANWEGTIMNLIPDEKATTSFLTKDRTVAFAIIECYYTLNNFFMKTKNGLFQNIQKLRNIPVTIVQGRYDIICPMRYAYDLHKSLPGSKLIIVSTGSHSPLEPAMTKELIKAGEEFKNLWRAK